ncbi:glycosyltransferase involved in cell wall biosynthesis [Salinibacter ruber]|nr:glycosyltransferase involved in cell wall biosynthesis [Salinibacter ruber]
MDPGRVEKELVLEEMDRWPGWAASAPVLYEPYQERRRAEWTHADAVVVNSEWSRKALTQQGVGEDKIHVVPLAYDASGIEPNLGNRYMRDGPLRVLWLGRVNLRKGIQYLVEAAGEMEDDLLQFDVVGPLKITEEVVDQAPSNMTFHGRVPRDEVSDYYRNADVFVLPTLSDGFAITQLEAMAHGLPVVTTPNCGRVVTDGEDGWIIPPRDSDVLAETLADCARHRAQLHQMAERAHATSKQYTLGRVADALRSIPPAA